MTCPVCHSQKTQHWIHCRDRLRDKPLPHHRYVRCLSCCVIFVHPQTTSQTYDEHYDAAYISHAQVLTSSGCESSRSRWIQQMRQRIWQDVFHIPSGLPTSGIDTRWFSQLLRHSGLFRHTPLKYPSSGRELLDVGSGAGTFLQQQKRLLWNVHGLEPHLAMVEQSQTLGLDVRQGFSIGEHWNKPTFDVIVLNQVFEHLTDPHALLVQAHTALNPGGVLYLNMPNVRSLPAQLFRSFWFNLDAPRHNLLFSPTTLKTLLENEGFTILDLYTASSTKGWSGSIEYVLRDMFHLKLPAGTIRKNRWINSVLIPVVRIIDWIHLGDTVHVIAKKQSL